MGLQRPINNGQLLFIVGRAGRSLPFWLGQLQFPFGPCFLFDPFDRTLKSDQKTQ